METAKNTLSETVALANSKDQLFGGKMFVQINDSPPVLCDMPAGVRYVEVQVTPDGIPSIVPSRYGKCRTST